MKQHSQTGDKGLQHLNGNVMCAIDTETTGLEAGVHDVVEVAIIPLGADLEVMRGVGAFHVYLKPKRPQNVTEEALKINKLNMADLQINGLDPWVAADLFEDWFMKLGLVPGKKIVPLAQNWPFDREFIRDWLGPVTFNGLIDYHFRDTCPVAQFLNDRSAFQISTPPFPKVNLQYLASSLGIETNRAHSALDDALTCAKVYRKMMTMFIK